MARGRLTPKNREPFKIPRQPIELNGITFEPYRLTGDQWATLSRRLGRLQQQKRYSEIEAVIGSQVISKIVTKWPFAAEISGDGFRQLGVVEAQTVLHSVVVVATRFAADLGMGSRAN